MNKVEKQQHPRLYVPTDVVEHLSQKLHSPYLQDLAGRALQEADRLVRSAPIRESQALAATYQPFTRQIDQRLQCLAAAWSLSGDMRYRKAALRNLAALAQWKQISCEANRATPEDVILPFCLSYGELSATVGFLYDIFHADMTEDERKVFFAVLDRFLLRAALRCLEHPPWWANKAWSNWNGVCAGGMGILALAVCDEKPEARKLLPFVEQSLAPYFQSYVENDGGCPEGTGYWNYGMNYAMRYVLSSEHALGKRHPALKIRQLKKSLLFPLDFTGISFGDNDGWGPTAFFFLLAKRLKVPEAALHASLYLSGDQPLPRKPQKRRRGENGGLLYAADALPTEAQIQRLRAQHAKQPDPVVRIYRNMGWAALADDSAMPRLRMAVRGGSSEVAGHGMIDLLSIRCRVQGALMITDQQDGGYMPSTFTRRGSDLYGRSSASKSTIFVDGLGCAENVSCKKTEAVRGDGLLGVRIDATGTILPRWKDVFIGRLVLQVENSYWLVVDQVLAAREVERHWLESRFHTSAESRCQRHGVALTAGKERMQMRFASLGGGMLQTSLGMPSQPQVPRTTIFRWMGKESAPDNLHVTALHPGRSALKLGVRRADRGYLIDVQRGKDYRRQIRLLPRLKLA